MKYWSSEISTHVHCALYAAIVLLVVVLHVNQPIESASSKLTIVSMSGFILAESFVKAIRGIRRPGG